MSLRWPPVDRSQEEIAQWYIENDLGHYDRQVRHRARDGWFLETGNGRATDMRHNSNLKREQIRLVSIDAVNPVTFHANRSGAILARDWEDKVKLFERIRGGCAACGEKQKTYDKGHLDRSVGMKIENIVPLCTGCNNHAQAYDFDYHLHRKSLKVRPVPRGALKKRKA